MLKDIGYLLSVTKDISKVQLEKNEMLQDSIIFRFIQISENLKRVLNKLRENNTHIPWNQAIGLRNKIIHEYGRIDLTIIYDVLTADLDNFFNNLKDIL